jgi:hypothetical protein
MAKRYKERSWRAYRLTGKKMIALGTVYARSEEEAIARAAEEFNVPKTLRNRILVRPEE